MAKTFRPGAPLQPRAAGVFGTEGVAEQYAVFLGADAEDPVVMKALCTHLSAPMPDGWIEQVDAKGRLYYWNDLTGEATWNHPDHDGLVEVQTFAQTVKDLQPWQRRRRMRDARLALERTAREALHTWSGPHLDPDGNRYYFDQAKGRSEWRNPALEALRQLLWRLAAMEGIVEGYRKDELDKTVLAAVMVQKLYRGYKTRKALRVKRPDHWYSATVIQQFYRRYRARRKFFFAAQTKQLMHKRLRESTLRHCAATVIASFWRTFWTRRWFL